MSLNSMTRREHADALLAPEVSESIFVNSTNGYTMNADLVLEVYQTFVELGTLTGNIDVFLPSVAAAKGRTYHIYMTNAANAATIKQRGNYTALDTSVSHSDSFNWDGDYVLTGADAYITIMSNGVSWTEVQSVL